jgi:hypothetical protein
MQFLAIFYFNQSNAGQQYPTLLGIKRTSELGSNHKNLAFPAKLVPGLAVAHIVFGTNLTITPKDT